MREHSVITIVGFRVVYIGTKHKLVYVNMPILVGGLCVPVVMGLRAEVSEYDFITLWCSYLLTLKDYSCD